MLLAIDSGNTNVVFAVFDGEVLRGNWRCANNARRTADEYAVWLTSLLEIARIPLSDITDCVIASVVPQALFNLDQLCRRYLDRVPLVVGAPGVDIGIGITIDRPEQVGADRLCSALAAYRRYGGPSIVIDFGTATTFDVIDRHGNYCGGVIAPGINLSAEALHMASAQLPRIEVRRPDRVVGRATIPAMQSGIFWGYIGLIEGLVDRIRGEYPEAIERVVGTGGLAPLFAEATDRIDHSDGELTIRGLLEIHRLNATR